MFASRGGSSMGAGAMALAVASGGLGFILADGLDRFLATYNPGGTELPKDKFTSNGAGTLANTLNVASKPSLIRLGAGGGAVLVPALASRMVRNSYVRASLEGMTLGAGVSLFRTLWNNLLMPLLLPKDTSTGSLQKNVIARLYPAEVAAHINLEQKVTSVSSGGSGALSGADPQLGVGAPDVGPFAGTLAGDPAYPDAAQALRREAGMSDQYPSLQNTWGTGGPGSDYPTAAQALRHAAGMSGYQPGPPSDVGPGPQAQPHKDPSCGCIGESNQFLGFVAGAPEEDRANTSPNGKGVGKFSGVTS